MVRVSCDGSSGIRIGLENRMDTCRLICPFENVLCFKRQTCERFWIRLKRGPDVSSRFRQPHTPRCLQSVEDAPQACRHL
jgi:hypothetical protein